MDGARDDCDHRRSGLSLALRNPITRAAGDEFPVLDYDLAELAWKRLRERAKPDPRPWRLPPARGALASAFVISWLELDSAAEVTV